jgi:hypothetical protein
VVEAGSRKGAILYRLVRIARKGKKYWAVLEWWMSLFFGGSFIHTPSGASSFTSMRQRRLTQARQRVAPFVLACFFASKPAQHIEV